MDFSLSSTADSSQFANLRIYDYDEDDSAWEDDQAWMIVPDSTGTYFSILSKADPNLAITAYGSAGEDTPGTTATSEGNVFVTEFTGANNQLWTIESGDRAVGCGNSIKSGGIYDKPEGSTSLSFVCPVTNYGDTVTWSSNNTYSTTVNQIGILVLGDFEPRAINLWNPNSLNQQQKDAMEAISKWLCYEYDLPLISSGQNAAPITTHRTVDTDTDCPGDNAAPWIENELRSMINAWNTSD